MAQVFISYGRSDRAFAGDLANAIQAGGWTVWWDRDIPAGVSFDRLIREQISESSCVCVLWTTRSAASNYVVGEARDAMRHDKLISVFLEPTERLANLLPYDIQAIHGVELPAWEPGTNVHGVAPLLAGIRRLAGSPARPRTRPARVSAPMVERLTQRHLKMMKMELVALKHELTKAGYPAGTGNTVDDAFVSAVTRLQADHGLPTDGIFGPQSLHALRSPSGAIRTPGRKR